MDEAEDSPTQIAVREFIRNQRDVVERLIEQRVRTGHGHRIEVPIQCFNVLAPIAATENRGQLVADALFEIVSDYLRTQHPELKLRSVRVVRFCGLYHRTSVDAVLVILRKRISR